MASQPKVVAVVGASTNRSKFGNKALRAYHRQGYRAIPIHPHARDVEGLRAYPSVLDVPGAIDAATLYVPPEVGERVLDELAQKGIHEVWVNPGAGSASLLARARVLGLTPIVACSILAIGESPGDY
jgi:uncharacterized protein